MPKKPKKKLTYLPATLQRQRTKECKWQKGEDEGEEEEEEEEEEEVDEEGGEK